MDYNPITNLLLQFLSSYLSNFVFSTFFLIPWRLENSRWDSRLFFPQHRKPSPPSKRTKDSQGDGVKEINQNKNTKNHDRAAHWTLNAANWVLSRARPDNLCAEKPSFLTAMTSPYWQNIWKIHALNLQFLCGNDHKIPHIPSRKLYNMPHLAKRKIIFKNALGWDMLVPRRVLYLLLDSHNGPM